MAASGVKLRTTGWIKSGAAGSGSQAACDQSTIASGSTYFIGFTGWPFTHTS